MPRKNTWLDDATGRQTKFYLGEADDFLIERETTRRILVQLFTYRFQRPENLRLLELGCGNGYISHSLADGYPHNNFTLVDGSSEMLGQARKRLRPGEISFIQDRLETCFTRQELQEKFDFIYSSNAIHHLNQLEKSALYQQIHDHLNWGGLFVNIDVVLPPSDLCEKWAFALWRDWMREKQLGRETPEPQRYDGLPGEYKRKEENQPGRLRDQLELLEQLGFQNVDCYYQYGIFALFAGTK